MTTAKAFQVPSRDFGDYLIEALKAEAECAAYREALKNVMRSGPEEREEIAEMALDLKNTKKRGMMMLKVVKAAVILGEYMRKGNEKDFLKALGNLETALGNFKLVGATAKKWLKESL